MTIDEGGKKRKKKIESEPDVSFLVANSVWLPLSLLLGSVFAMQPCSLQGQTNKHGKKILEYKRNK